MGPELLAAAAIMSAVGTVVGGISTFQQSRAQAKSQEQQANFARQQAEIDANEFRRKQRRLLGTARAARGATGVDLLTGSPLLVDDDTIDEIIFQTERVRQGGDITASRLETQASLTRAQGSSALAGSVLSAGGTFLTSDVGQGLFSGSGGGSVVASTSAGRADMRQPNAMGGRSS